MKVGVFSARHVCNSGAFTTSGECCKQCPPGEGVVQSCGATQTVCEPCLDSETFSEHFSHTEKCSRCTDCSGLLRMEKPCTDTDDATCVCDYGYFMSEITGQCQACTACPLGSGVLRRCSPTRDTICETCIDDTYSDQESELNLCLPCTICEDTEELQHCTPVSDTVCQGLPESTDTMPTVGPETEKLGLGYNLIPLYASIVPTVLLGLVAFIIIKRWKSCKHNKQDGGNRSGTENPSQTPSPEGEKLHSDSGISVDSQSLQEGQGLQHTVLKIDGGPSLPLHACEELEKLLDDEGPLENDWSSLAGLLGYEEERIASFGQEERPVRALLSDWSSRDSASIDALCAALRKINREDLAQSIMPKPTATSVVGTIRVNSNRMTLMKAVIRERNRILRKTSHTDCKTRINKEHAV
ncbi:Tumor necrosis factor receptor superfamily member 16 [Bagarius yarrelli]|uniref:Tumor necrosis factor receptor superfamily member 16 n=1 Tax=Bagarius yarrelli TaxID=175774 RepID=A0A556VV92_BAGYA|nr:Tumor necrosis factor receptor superfamily member 16 [Bagarius yarrelli]